MKYFQFLITIFLIWHCTTTLAITRAEVIDNAERYATHQWTVLKGNNNATFNTLKQGQRVEGLPYNWGGWDTIEQFETKIKKGRVAGKIFSKAVNGKEAYLNFAGIDCSGFVTRVWEKKSKYGTATLPTISKKISWSELKAGDIINRRGKHVRLFHQRAANGALWFYESTASSGINKVIHRILPRDNSYKPRRFNDIQENTTYSPAPSIPTISNPTAPSITPTPIITSLTPNRLQTLPVGQRQWLIIKGKNFTPSSKLELEMLGVNRFPNRVPYYVNDTELRYPINVGKRPNKWTIKIVNNSKYSNIYPFQVTKNAAYSGQYPQASSRYLKSRDLANKSSQELRLMRNEIFARHGYIFQSADMKSYFQKQPWYQPKQTTITKQQLNPIERANIKFIQQTEKILTPNNTTDEYPIILVAWLTEIGYINIRQPPHRLDNQQIQKALKSFQRDSRLSPTGNIDKQAWNKLSQIALTAKTKTQLRFLITNKFKNFNALKSCDSDLIWLAALLNEMGYLSSQQLLNASKLTFQKALIQFQKDIGKGNQFSTEIWERLSAIQLTSKTKEYINHLRCK